MATDSTTSNTTDSTDETSGQGSQDQQQQTTDETSGNGDAKQVTIDDSTKLPDTHPLVKTLATLKEKTSSQARELTEARAQAAKVTQLEEDLGKRPTTEAMETLQTRYDRLEAFLVAAGGPLGKALDSRTFTRDLFETDTDIKTLVQQWHRDNPSATSQALGNGPAGDAKGKQDPNHLLRVAAGKA
ncbi:scaffolding protein [Microbacterium phage Luna18]|nr:scaffolding protein [Microbacterium phage Chepli]QZE10295.1 scaffolding protein [Microbacterium phage KatChan]URQ04858.1 scaffolding protein [Microbacterium phage Luna18]